MAEAESWPDAASCAKWPAGCIEVSEWEMGYAVIVVGLSVPAVLYFLLAVVADKKHDFMANTAGALLGSMTNDVMVEHVDEDEMDRYAAEWAVERGELPGYDNPLSHASPDKVTVSEGGASAVHGSAMSAAGLDDDLKAMGIEPLDQMLSFEVET